MPAEPSSVKDGASAAADAAGQQHEKPTGAQAPASLLEASQPEPSQPYLNHDGQKAAAAPAVSKSRGQPNVNQLADIPSGNFSQQGQAQASRPHQQGHDAHVQGSAQLRTLEPNEQSGQAGQNGAAPVPGQPAAVTQMVPAELRPVDNPAAASALGTLPAATSVMPCGVPASAAAEQPASLMSLPQVVAAEVCIVLCSLADGHQRMQVQAWMY